MVYKPCITQLSWSGWSWFEESWKRSEKDGITFFLNRLGSSIRRPIWKSPSGGQSKHSLEIIFLFPKNINWIWGFAHFSFEGEWKLQHTLWRYVTSLILRFFCGLPRAVRNFMNSFFGSNVFIVGVELNLTFERELKKHKNIRLSLSWSRLHFLQA